MSSYKVLDKIISSYYFRTSDFEYFTDYVEYYLRVNITDDEITSKVYWDLYDTNTICEFYGINNFDEYRGILRRVCAGNNLEIV